MTDQPTWTAAPLRHDNSAIMICAECLKPLRFEAVSTGARHIQQAETVPCPYGPHAAGKRNSVGWWKSFAVSPEQQAFWLAARLEPNRDAAPTSEFLSSAPSVIFGGRPGVSGTGV